MFRNTSLYATLNIVNCTFMDFIQVHKLKVSDLIISCGKYIRWFIPLTQYKNLNFSTHLLKVETPKTGFGDFLKSRQAFTISIWSNMSIFVYAVTCRPPFKCVNDCLWFSLLFSAVSTNEMASSWHSWGCSPQRLQITHTRALSKSTSNFIFYIVHNAIKKCLKISWVFWNSPFLSCALAWYTYLGNKCFERQHFDLKPLKEH